MANVDFTSLRPKKAKRKPVSVKTKRVLDRTGALITLHTIDADSATFDSDLSYVFERNVAKARRENRRLFGFSDRVSSKG